MPPAFNLSQDQTLQFDLEFTHKGIEETRNKFRSISHERLKSIRPRAIADSWHSSSNAHAYRLLIFKELRRQTVVCCVALTCCQRRSGILSCFSKPCQALSFRFVSPTVYSSPEFAALSRRNFELTFDQRSLPFYA